MTRILLTSYGWEDAGGGTRVPRNVARELRRRGHDVTVFHAAHADLDGAEPYAVRSWDDRDGVHLVGVHNRAHLLLDVGHPLREIDDPAISAAFGRVLDRCRPDVVHFHNLHNLGASLIDETRLRGIASFFSTHNHWLVCPRAYLVTGDRRLCDGRADEGRACATCVGAPHLVDAHARRRAEVRDRFTLGVEACLAVSESVADTLVRAGYEPGQVTVLRQAMPEPEALWEAVGRDRGRGRVGGGLVVGFIGSVYQHKGPDVLVEAAALLPEDVTVRIHGEIGAATAARLLAGDATGRVELRGAFEAGDLPAILAAIDVAVVPSVIQDCAPLVIAECLAARVPVVGSRIGGIPEAIRDGIDGLVCAPGDPTALAAALSRIASEAGLLERLQDGIVAPRPFAAFVDDLEQLYAHGPGTIGAARPQAGAGGGTRRLLAAPAWSGSDRLGELLAAWASAFGPDDDVALVLLADEQLHGDIEDLAATVEGLVGDAPTADIVLQQVAAGDALDLAEACDGFVALHRGAPGLLRRAALRGRPIVAPEHAALLAWAHAPVPA